MSVHPTIQRVITRAYLRGHGELPQQSVSTVRKYYEQQSYPPLKDINIKDIDVKPELKIRLYRPFETHKPLPVILYLRASAYIFGKMNDSDYISNYLAKNLQCNVIALEPRLSPEAKFPVPFEDCITSIKYIVDNHVQLKLDLSRVALWGESSGGNIAAAISHYLKEEKTDLISNQILFYPMLDYSDQHHYPSKSDYGKGYLMDNALADWILDKYLSKSQDYHDVRASPLLADNFENLPSTLVVAAQYDPARDEANAYIQNLVRSNVKTRALFLPGLIHGFLWYYEKVKEAQFALIYASDYLKEQFAQ